MDRLDQKIIEILTNEGRASYKEIAQRLRISESAVRKRIGKLVENRIIDHFTVIINPETGHEPIEAFLTIMTSHEYLKKIQLAVMDIDQVKQAYRLGGRCGIITRIEVESMPELHMVIDTIQSTPGITGTEGFIVLTKLK